MIARHNTPPPRPPGATKDAVARTLATRQHDVEPDIELVFRLEAPGREEDPDEPIKLLIVNPNTVATGIMPLQFLRDPDSGIPYRSVIVEIHTSEWDDVLAGRLTLPDGWRFDPQAPLAGSAA